MMHVSETKWTELETQRPTKKKKNFSFLTIEELN